MLRVFLVCVSSQSNSKLTPSLAAKLLFGRLGVFGFDSRHLYGSFRIQRCFGVGNAILNAFFGTLFGSAFGHSRSRGGFLGGLFGFGGASGSLLSNSAPPFSAYSLGINFPCFSATSRNHLLPPIFTQSRPSSGAPDPRHFDSLGFLADALAIIPHFRSVSVPYSTRWAGTRRPRIQKAAPGRNPVPKIALVHDQKGLRK